MHRYEVAIMMNENRLTNSFKSYVGWDDDEQVKFLGIFLILNITLWNNTLAVYQMYIIGFVVR